MRAGLAAFTFLLGSVLAASLAGCVGYPTSPSKSPTEAAVQTDTAPQPLEIVESGWSVNEDGYVTYAAIVRNPNAGWRCEMPSLNVVLKDGNGKVLERFGDTPLAIEPSSQVALAGTIGNDRQGVSNIDFSMDSDGGWSVSAPAEADLYSIVGLTRGATVDSPWPDESFQGKVTRNHFVPEEENAAVLISVVARDKSGAIVGGGSTVMEGIPLKKETAFEVPCFVPQESAASYEAFARPSPKIMA